MLRLQKRGLSDIVVTVLIILMVIGAVSIIWGYLRSSVSSGGAEITTMCTTLDLQPVSCSYNDTAVFVKYGRNAGVATLTNVSLVFEIGGETKVYSATSVPNPLETKAQILYDVAGIPTKFGVSGTVTTESGKSKACPESYKIVCAAGGDYVAPPSQGGFSCTGGDPANAAICSGDDSGLSANTPKTLVANCGAAKCEFTCVSPYLYSSSTGTCVLAPSFVQGLNVRVFTGAWGDTHPSNHQQLVALFGPPSNLALTTQVNTAQNINWGVSPWSGINDNFVTEYTGYLNIPVTGSYSFFVDGDDAVEIEIDNTVVAFWYNGHGICGGNQVGCANQGQTAGTVTLTAGYHPFVYRQEEGLGGEGAFLWWKKPTDSVFEIVPTTAFYR